jgi:hypothetical protein
VRRAVLGTIGWLIIASWVQADPAALRETIAALTAPELAGRGAGTPDERRAAEQVARWFEAAGLAPAFAGQWLQPVPWQEQTSVNVAGVLPGRGPLAGRWLVVGAHVDHLGRVTPGDGIPEPGAYYPGAGDNASGVAVLRELPSWVTTIDGPRRSVLFCGFGAEEQGLVGSRFLVANLPVPPGRVDAMVNLDAVGRLADGPLHVAGAATCEAFASPLAAIAADLDLVRHDPLLLGSDHLGFLEAGIPALFLFTGGYPEMNSPADSLGAIDLAGLERVLTATGELVTRLAVSEGSFDFVTPSEVARPSGGNRATWFGTAPDFSGATASDGYLVGGVAADGPAARAGIREGDVVTALAGRPVSDLASFTQALRQCDPGDLVEVELRRDGKRLDLLVTLGDRAQRVR